MAMAARGVPVIHCLFIRGLCRIYGLAWDPRPLPEPGRDLLFERIREREKSFIVLSLIYLMFMFLVFVFTARNKQRRIFD
jgi:hypothetical protein